MNHPDEPLDPREEALVRALHAQAETVRPAGDGLVHIRARVERRRSRARWVVPTASAAAVAATVTAVVASGVFTSGRHSSQLGLNAASLTAATTPTVIATSKAKRTAVPTPVPVPVASPTKTARAGPSVTPPSPDAPTTTVAVPAASTVAADHSTLVGPTPVWPFHSAAEAAAWQQKPPADEAWRLDAVQTAEHFVNTLNLKGVTLTGKPVATPTNGGLGTTVVVLQRKGDAETPVTLATVTLALWSSKHTGPWGVVSVTSPSLTVSEDTVGGPLQVSAPGDGESQLSAAVYPAGAPAASTALPVPASGIVSLPTIGSSGPGFVVVTNVAGGGATPTVGGLAVIPVQLPAGTPASDTYVALENGVVTVIDVATGNVVRTLAAGTPGVGGVAVTDNGEWVYLATTKGVLRSSLLGSSAPTVVTNDPATQIAVAGKNGEQLVYTYVSPDGQGQSLTYQSSVGGGIRGNIQISQSLPPEAETLAISPNGGTIASWVRGASQGAVELFTLPTATEYAQGTVPKECRGTNGCGGATYAPNGDLVYATTDGTKVTVYRDHLGKPAKLFEVAASIQTVVLDTDPSGDRVLVLQRGGGQGWVWNGTTATAMPAGVTDASW